MTGPRLYINIDHVATIREARKADEPNPIEAAMLAEDAGADGITVHLREDRRHINDADVMALAERVTTVLNLELAQSEDILALACRLAPYQVTLVPERREEITTEGGLVVQSGDARLQNTVARLQDAGMRVSFFVDPDPTMIEAAHAFGVAAVELHTGRYAGAWRDDPGPLQELTSAVEVARGLGLAVHAGHGLSYDNVRPVAALDGIEELNIGHSIVSRAVMVGIGPAVAEMRRLVQRE